MKQDYFEHFGMKFNKELYTEYMTIDNFVIKPKWETDTLKPGKLAIEGTYRNYQTNIRFFQRLNKEEFNKVLDDFIKLDEMKNAKEIFNLDECKDKQGIYILVLGNYKQIYIGQTKSDLKTRIARHWKNRLPMLKAPCIRAEILPIDCFSAKDTTRIFVIYEDNDNEIDKLERKLIDLLPKDYRLNKTVGGQPQTRMDLLEKLMLKFNRDFDDNFNIFDDLSKEEEKD
jgi:hypothetical protein